MASSLFGGPWEVIWIASSHNGTLQGSPVARNRHATIANLHSSAIEPNDKINREGFPMFYVTMKATGPP